MPLQDQHISNTTNAEYPIAVCLLVGNPHEIQEVPFVNPGIPLNKKSSVLISGHPQKVILGYLYPGPHRNILKKEIQSHFCNFKCKSTLSEKLNRLIVHFSN